MPYLVALLVTAGLELVWKLLLSLGIGVTTYTVALPALKAFINSYFTGLPSNVLQMLGILRIDIAITIIISAAAANLTYRVAVGAITRN